MSYRLCLALLLGAVSATSCATALADAHMAPHPQSAPVLEQAARTASNDRGLTLDISAHVATAPAQVVVRTRVEPDVRNRLLTIEWWNTEGVGGSHQLTLDGDAVPPRVDYPIKRMSAGEYRISVELKRNDGSLVRRETTAIIIAEGERLNSGDLTRPTSAVSPRSSIPW